MWPIGLEPVLFCGRLRCAAALQCLEERAWPSVGGCLLADGTTLRLRGADPDRKGHYQNRGRDRLHCHSTAPAFHLRFLTLAPGSRKTLSVQSDALFPARPLATW